MTLNGIDVSSWQNGIKTGQLPVDFVIAKATEGTGYVSPDCVRQVEEAHSAGKKTGTYHYINGSGAEAEAQHYIDNIKGWLHRDIIAVDWEQTGNSAWGNTSYLESVVKAIIDKTGVKPLIYGSQAVYQQLNQVAAKYDCGLWIAQYANMNATGFQDTPWNEGAYKCAMRQYSSAGAIQGWSGNLDLDKFYGDAAAWDAYASASKSGEAPKPASAPAPNPNPAPAPKPASGQRTYTVQKGDTLSGIAAKFGTNYQHLADINGIKDPNHINIGQVIRIDSAAPAPAPAATGTYVVKRGDTLSGIATKFGTSVGNLVALNGIKDPNRINEGQVLKVNGHAPAPAPAPARTYTVKPGDTLSGIASRFGTTYQHLAQINGIQNPDHINVGQTIRY